MRTTWLFQANPDSFKVEEFLTTKPSEFLWLVRRYADEINFGDQVFIWQAKGSGDPDKSGIIAEAEIAGPVFSQEDEASSSIFWHSDVEITPLHAGAVPRVRLKLIRVAPSKGVLKREWLKEDPVLSDLLILRLATGTNFKVPVEHAGRLNALWSKVGQDWTYAESVAGMWAFKETRGGPVSRLPGSVVSDLSLLISRVVPGIYNKIMNFRHLDPEDARRGLSGGGEADGHVWTRFYDDGAKSILTRELDEEYARLWRNTDPRVQTQLSEPQELAFQRAVTELVSLPLSILERRCSERGARELEKPRVMSAITTRFTRRPEVAALARVRARHQCELPGCTHSIFLGVDGLPYCEVHHIEFLSAGGPDTANNVACLCPGHHREAHFGQRAGIIAETLSTLRATGVL